MPPAPPKLVPKEKQPKKKHKTRSREDSASESAADADSNESSDTREIPRSEAESLTTLGEGARFPNPPDPGPVEDMHRLRPPPPPIPVDLENRRAVERAIRRSLTPRSQSGITLKISGTHVGKPTKKRNLRVIKGDKPLSSSSSFIRAVFQAFQGQGTQRGFYSPHILRAYAPCVIISRLPTKNKPQTYANE